MLIAGIFRHLVEGFIARKRRRETFRILSALPDEIRHDIGWPDMYERPRPTPSLPLAGKET
jgi:hypothetical protein